MRALVELVQPALVPPWCGDVHRAPPIRRGLGSMLLLPRDALADARTPDCMPSGPGRTGSVMTVAEMPLATAEFLAVDVETNGAPGEDCELTEVGAVLVGGGELHDRFESLVRVTRPLSRGIQRFTGITQEMVADAAPPASILPELARRISGRVLGA